MFAPLRNPTYAKLFSAQVIALLGTGLLTVALGLLAFDIAGTDAGIVLGLAMTIKMVAYVVVSPVATTLVAHLPRKVVLIAADLVRACIAVTLPFVTEAWQIYVLIFLLQSASATFTPTFQAVIPSVLPDEREYTRALSLSRLAYDLESLASPMIAAALLTVLNFHTLFAGTAVGFLASAAFVAVTRFPEIDPLPTAPFADRLTRGARIFLARPELRGLMGANLVVATTTAMVIVNTVPLVQAELGRPQTDVALLLAAFGGGSMLVALCLPFFLDVYRDVSVMRAGVLSLPALLLLSSAAMSLASGTVQWVALLGCWALLGAATSLALTPSAQLLRRNAAEQHRPSLFAAQFSLSHACYLVTYPLAGVLGATVGLAAVALVLVGIGTVGAVAATLAWQHADRATLPDHVGA